MASYDTKDRWHQLADAMQDSNLPASDKSVFRYLLDRADYKTAELPAKFTPTQRLIARKTSVSYSQVRYSLHHLQRHGWLIISGKSGPARPRHYEFRVGAGCHCTGRVHVADVVTHVTSQLSNPSHTKTGPDLHGWHRVTDVTDLRGNGGPDIADSPEQCQPKAPTVPTDDPRTVPTNGANAAGQTVRPTERHREGDKEETAPKPVVLADRYGPIDRESFDDWLSLISGRADPQPARGTVTRLPVCADCGVVLRPGQKRLCAECETAVHQQAWSSYPPTGTG
jgi:hypothetical protein